ncbi:response regulator [Lusitaniella coriacea]|uniref:response regulator n=1 Tax=Lusitaniella coriacea TaxID=1983105 RepID=UPI001E5CC9A2|nr:response regulator [Lusitaniella coriacea]
MLDIERIESGKVAMTPQECDAANLMRISVEAMQPLMQEASISLSVSPLSLRLFVDRDRIVQVLTNLLSNAIKFSAPGDTIELSAKRTNSPGEAEMLCFKVKDCGRGIPPDKLEKIFNRFEQVDASDSRSKGGTGLGLAVCRSIVQHHGGRIWAESTMGEGSAFFVALPVALNLVPEAKEVSAVKRVPANSNHPLILICDDDASVRAVLKNLLERQNYRAIAVESGQEALQQAAQYQPDAILLNLMMPQMNGWETLEALKAQINTKNIPAIILSGILPDAREAPPDGVDDWIVKPPDEHLLFQALERSLRKKNRQTRVLIVEDDVDLAQVLITLFERHGIETYHAQTGREAIQLSQQIMPDLLVLDLILPQYDGFAVVDWLRQHNALCYVPLVVYTSKDLEDGERERLRLGQTVFLTKGCITPEQFEQRAIALLDRVVQGKEENRNDAG